VKKYRAVFLIALTVRFAFWAGWAWKGLDQIYARDLYYDLARSWLGWISPFAMDATHPPLYTAFIAAILGLFRGPNPAPILVLQMFLSAAICPLTFWLGTRLASENVGRMAALWVAFDPELIFFSPQLQTETLFLFMEMSFFVWLYDVIKNDNSTRWNWFGLGILGGLSALCRSVFVAYPVFLVIALWKMKGVRKILIPILLLFAGWLAPISLWTARNWAKYHRIVPISAQMGWTLYEGFSTDREEIRRRPYEMEKEAEEHGLTDPMARSDYFKAKTIAFIRTHPVEAVRIVIGKALLYWRPWPYDPHPWVIRLLLSTYFSVLILFAGHGIWLTRKRLTPWLPILALFIYLTLAHSVLFTSLRYRLPLEPFLCLLASVRRKSEGVLWL
jgi:4-amino-4-deoxy-L-arabinose transferase-like glycosyltransferase